jgi:signal transduction histidine kinase
MWAYLAFGSALLASALALRRWPLAAVAVMLAGSVFITALRPPWASTLLIVLAGAAGVEIFYLAATRTRRISATAVAIIGVGLLIPLPGGDRLALLRGGTAGPGVALVTLIAWLIGNSIRQAQAQAELVRAQAAAQTAMAERLRIARELHDVVAHSIGIIAIQAGAGRRVFDARPAEARDALATIEATSRETLSGLRRMMTGLRRAEPERGQAAPLDPSAFGPAPGLADIERLAAMTRDAGVTVDVDWRGSREMLPADIDLAAFRIIQEAVTNVVRHAGTDRCLVSISRPDGQLSIEVTDGGRGGPGTAPVGGAVGGPVGGAVGGPVGGAVGGPVGGAVVGTGAGSGIGYGITGMSERAALLGGDLSAGPRPGGGFRVAARLPLPGPAR